METLVIDPSELPGDEDEVVAPAAKKPSLPAPKVKTSVVVPTPDSVVSSAAEPEIKAKRAYKKRNQDGAPGTPLSVELESESTEEMSADDSELRVRHADVIKMSFVDLASLRYKVDGLLSRINYQMAIRKA